MLGWGFTMAVYVIKWLMGERETHGYIPVAGSTLMY
jgi:hypothetical protein